MSQPLNTRLTLLQKLQQSHDERDWEDFVRYYEGYIYVVLRSFGLSPEDCEDLLQEVLVKVWKALPSYDYQEKRCRFRTWLCVVVRNTVTSFRRRKSTRNNSRNVDLEGVVDKVELMTEAEIDAISEREWKVYVSNMAWDNVKEALPKLSREVFEASLTEQDNAKLAERFDVAESTVRVYKMRARKALCKEIARLDREMGG
jgi:RNA polymerase sigma factor (sigma-70 family)